MQDTSQANVYRGDYDGKRLKYGALIDRLRKRAALAKEINERQLEGDLLDAAAALSELKE